MTQIAVSLVVAAIIATILWRYKTVFCLPFFWAALFAFIFVGLLQLHAQFGGSSYLYAATGFGMYFLGLLAADFIFFHRPGFKRRHRQASDNSGDTNSKPAKPPQPTRIRLLFPALPLSIGLFVSLLAATFVTIIFFANQGFPILSSNPALAWVQSTSGVVNRLMTIFGPGCYAVLGVMAWAVYRETDSPMAKGMMYLGLGLAIVAQGLLATKSAAILVYVWFNILLFYMNKQRNLWKTLLPLIVIVVPVSAAIVAVRMVSSFGYWQAQGIYDTYVDRLTTIAADPLDFTFKYMERFGGPMHGRALHLEMKRISEQFTGAPKTPVITEFVYNLMEGLPPDSVDLSVTLTPEGTGYIEWGMAGLLIYSFLQGLGFGLVHRHLYRQESMNLVSLVVWSGIVSYGIQLSSTGIILVGLEGVALTVLPPLLLLLPFCIFFLLPMARRYRNTASRTISKFPSLQVQADRGAER
ncbi:MAG TPA: O-antigen polymerase [Terriglobia bacterium]|nr:O-antigen polymerase [Terriglobia bacterium]